MFDFDASKLLIVGVIALIFIPSKDLPRVLRQVGQFVAKARRMAREFQGQFMDAMREADMADLKREAQKLAETARVDVGLDSVTDLTSHVTRAVDAERRPVAAEAAAPQHETMDNAGMKDPNDELRRLTSPAATAPSKEPAPLDPADRIPPPAVHTAL